MVKKNKKSCSWAVNNPLMKEYHDKEWGTPVHDDRLLFEFLILEGVQAGLSWNIVLQKRENYRKAFEDFDYKKIVNYREKKVEELLQNKGIIRNRRKIEATISNAKAFMEIQKEFGSFDAYIWRFIDHKPIQNAWKSLEEIPAKTDMSETISKDLKKRGFKFIGPTVIYAFMQAVGMVNDHTSDCFRYYELKIK
ncbi:MAG: DNA-3-methyladenine glycosylase I [Promethearchaeota archaeon]